MKEQFTTYLKGIGMSDILTRRAEEIHEFYRAICPEEITDIFVSEFVKEDGIREYENLWFFSQKYVMEAKSFILKDLFDMTIIHKQLKYWTIEKMSYDFVNAMEKSRMTMSVKFETVSGIFKASKENCDFLRDVFRRNILPNLIIS